MAAACRAQLRAPGAIPRRAEVGCDIDRHAQADERAEPETTLLPQRMPHSGMIAAGKLIIEAK